MNVYRELLLTFFCLLGTGVTPAPLVAENDDATSEVMAVPTFNCVGLRWKTEFGGPRIECFVRYREMDTNDWSDALPLWFDENEHEGEFAKHSYEYRGSIVGLKEGTTYEIALRLSDESARKTFLVQTWDSDFKIARTVTLPRRINETYTITEGGSEEAGYVLYEAAESGSVLDGKSLAKVNISVKASYVIIRGLTLKNAVQHGIQLGNVQNVVIEGCDISGWGQNLEDGWGRNFDSAIFHETPDGERRTLRRIVIQDNRLHHPRSNSNSWMQRREIFNGSRHPIGPQAITVINGDGEMVIRHNDIYSDFDHMFNDAIGEYHNFGYAGFPARDSDIYGNKISHCWDDGLELEGANLNVRCWGNVIDQTFGGIATAGTSLGPIYVYRNVYLRSRKGPGESEEAYRGQFFLKLGGDPRNEHYAKGRIYVFHNTLLQPEGWWPEQEHSGARSGLKFSNSKKLQTNVQSRNNVLWVKDESGHSVYDGQNTPLNDFDYDLFNGRVTAHQGSETNGIQAEPTFGLPIDADRPWARALLEGTAGHDAALPLPNFNEEYSGQGPDMGAFEEGMPIPPYFPLSDFGANRN